MIARRHPGHRAAGLIVGRRPLATVRGMKIGFLTMNAASGIAPARLAVRARATRGFESIWVPEHSHIPVSRQTPYPGGGDLPGGYWHMMDPLVSLAAAAAATTRSRWRPGSASLLEHDLLDLACRRRRSTCCRAVGCSSASASAGTREELANHRPDLPFGPALRGDARAGRRPAGGVDRGRGRLRRPLGPLRRVVGLPQAAAAARAHRARQRRAGRHRATPPSTPTSGAPSAPSCVPPTDASMSQGRWNASAPSSPSTGATPPTSRSRCSCWAGRRRGSSTASSPSASSAVVLGGGTELDDANTTLRLLDALSELL